MAEQENRSKQGFFRLLSKADYQGAVTFLETHPSLLFYPDEFGHTALFHALILGHGEFVRSLLTTPLADDIDLEHRDALGRTLGDLALELTETDSALAFYEIAQRRLAKHARPDAQPSTQFFRMFAKNIRERLSDFTVIINEALLRPAYQLGLASVALASLLVSFILYSNQPSSQRFTASGYVERLSSSDNAKLNAWLADSRSIGITKWSLERAFNFDLGRDVEPRATCIVSAKYNGNKRHFPIEYNRINKFQNMDEYLEEIEAPSNWKIRTINEIFPILSDICYHL